MHLPELGAFRRARRPGLEWSEVQEPSASFSHPHTPASRIRRPPNRRWAGGGRVEVDVAHRLAITGEPSFFLSCQRARRRLFQPRGRWEGGGNAGFREQTGCGRLTLLPQCLESHPLATSLTPTRFRKTRPPRPASLSSYDLLYLCDHLLLCSLADSGSMILFFPAPGYPENWFLLSLLAPLLKLITALSTEAAEQSFSQIPL